MKIVIRDLEIWYNSIKALSNISLEIVDGELTFVIGPNGAGKSTLLKAISLIVPPKWGVIYIDGRDVKLYSVRELAKTIAYVAPHISRSIPSTVLDYLMTARYPYTSFLQFKEDKTDLEVIDKVSRQMNIIHLLNRRLDQLSSGELQRVVIARALTQQPKIILLDEPSAFLDLRYRLEILEHIKNITRTENLITIIAIHDLYLASLYADKIILLSNGSIAACGNVEEVLKEEVIERIYGVRVELLEVKGKRIILPVEPLTLSTPQQNT
ncbi:MAG: ABC transporter ATP-binding protein [Ignisphaera sp.]|nr:ABC transporter ATP-binding protein [Ignisphaera sp.]MCX8168216.1 ABC transporter ATP-binding protein [Ignisphaera sp.]MDW8084914.1 ABC transporter ATP-binding protein [Ignisphaera sp.]